MECVAFKNALDFELERPTSTKSLESLELCQWLQQQDVCGVLLDTVSVIRFKSNEKYSCCFY